MIVCLFRKCEDDVVLLMVADAIKIWIGGQYIVTKIMDGVVLHVDTSMLNPLTDMTGNRQIVKVNSYGRFFSFIIVQTKN